MHRIAPAPARTERISRTLALLVVSAGLVVALGALVVATAWTGTTASGMPALAGGPSAGPASPGWSDGVVDRADGVLPDGVTAFDEDLPGVAGLDPALLAALRDATVAAAEDGIAIVVNSGWRSAEHQDQLLAEAVAEHGSLEEAARWVATSTTSPHVSGDAVDIGPFDAMDWVARHGAAHGLCRIYANEPWHVELRPDAVERGCPPPYPDPTHDPRMQG
ncbi:M15 family metallopeptidase [Euzebya sp.]|uniref:M15 family metallopeptidase n=1 Tax=Euzebya sp. TaxID=1971409 RepID=UPI0035135A90